MYGWMGRHTLTCSELFDRADQGEGMMLPNGQGQGGRYEILMLWGVWQHVEWSNGNGMVKGIGRVDLGEEPPHGVSSQDLVAAMWS